MADENGNWPASDNQPPPSLPPSLPPQVIDLHLPLETIRPKFSSFHPGIQIRFNNFHNQMKNQPNRNLQFNFGADWPVLHFPGRIFRPLDVSGGESQTKARCNRLIGVAIAD